MRSAYKVSFLGIVFLCLTAQAQQKTNPHTQISWPGNCNSDPHMVYNWQANVCVHVGPVGNSGEVQLNNGGVWYSLPGFSYNFSTNTLTAPNLSVPGTAGITIPPAQVTWPGSCTSGVYSPATNTCVAPGTAANPAAPSGSGQMNSGGIFASIPGFMSDATNGWITAGGKNYAKGYQTGSGANGIVNSIAYGRTVAADPSYVVTTTANMTQGSATFTVANPAGIVVGQQVVGNVICCGTVSSVVGNTVTLVGTWAQTTNPSATVTFYEMPYALNNYNIPNASLFHLDGQQVGATIDLKRDPSANPFSRTEDFNTEGCFLTTHQAWTGSQNVVACHHIDQWLAAPASNYGTTAAGHGFPSSWGISTALSLNNVASSKGIGSLVVGSHAKAAIGDGPLAYFYYVDYLGSIAGADEGQGGIFMGGGEGVATTTGLVTAGGSGATQLSISCSTDCSANSNNLYGGPGQGRYFIDMSHPLLFNMTGRTSFSGDTPGTISTDTAVPVSTFWGTISTTSITGNISSGSNQITSLSSTTLLGAGMQIAGTGIPAFTTIVAVNTGASSLTMSANATANTTGLSITAGGDIITPPPLSASGKPFAEQNPATTQAFIVAGGTFNSVANPGPPHIGDLICFSGTYHEQAKISNVAGSGPWSVTAALRMPHQSGSGSWVFANGTCGDFVDFTANDVAAPGGGFPAQTLHYPFDIIGSTNANTIVYRWFSNLLTSTFFPLGNINFPFTATGTLVNQGGIVNTLVSGATSAGHPELIGQPVITIAGATNANFNGPCYNVQINGQGQLTCFQSASNNQTTTPGANYTYSIGTTGFGTTQGVLWQGAETLDVLDYNETNCAAYLAPNGPKHAPCYDNQNMVLEPNAAAWSTSVVTAPITSWAISGNVATFQTVNTLASNDIVKLSGFPTSTFFNNQTVVITSASGTQFTANFSHANGSGTESGTVTRNGDTVEQSHHYSSQLKGTKFGFNFFDPYQQANTNGFNWAVQGPGVNGAAAWSTFQLINLNGVGMYQGHGGALPPPGGITVGGGALSQGSVSSPGFNYGLNLSVAPEPNGLGRGMGIGCPSLPWGCNDPTYNYKWAEALGRVSGNYILYNAYNSDMLLGNPNSPVTWNGVNNDINYLQVRDQIKLSPMATPVINTITPATANGTIPDGTRRYYTITARNFAGWSLASAEVSQITGTSGSNANTLTVFWSHVDGATQYQVCEGSTTGSELLLATVAGVDNTSFVDAGGTASGGCQNIATAPPMIFTSQNTAFTDSLQAATGNAGNITHTLPPTGGTVGLGLTLPTGTPTLTAGTNVTSCGCAASYTCTNSRGRLTIVGGTATTGTICTVNWSANLTNSPFFTVGEMGATALHGLDHGVPTGTFVTITAAISVSGATINVDYTTQP